MEKIDSKYVKNCKYVALQCLDHCVDFDKQKQSWIDQLQGIFQKD